MDYESQRQERFRTWSAAIAQAEALCAPLHHKGSFAEVLATWAAARPKPPGGLAAWTKAHRSDDPLDGDIDAASCALRTGRVSAVDLTRRALDRLEKIGECYNAVVHIDGDQALDTAASLDARRTELPLSDQKLWGIPLAHKDMFSCSVRQPGCGSRFNDLLPPSSPATVVTRLEEQGAVTLGSLHMTELAFDPSGCNPMIGDCLNPWHREAITGGSSSGSAVAVAMGAVFGAFGSDTGGSIRLPAALCGVTGLKPTFGRVSRHGAMPLSQSHDHVGPLARTARECALLFSCVAGADPKDPTTDNASTYEIDALRSDHMKGLRIGVDTEFFRRDLHPEIARRLDDSLRVFTDAGATVLEVPAFPYALLNAIAAMMVRVEAGILHAEGLGQHPERYSPALAERLRAAAGFPVETYRRAVALRGSLLHYFLSTVMAGVDVLHLPILSIETPKRAAAAADQAPGFVIGTELTRLTRPVNFLGLPALAVPCGVYPTKDGTQLPTAFQLVGHPFAEELLFAVGDHYQQVAGSESLLFGSWS